jgi:hypothetical protein
MQKDDELSLAPSDAYTNQTPTNTGKLRGAISQKTLSRPGSAYVFYSGNKSVIKKHKGRLGLKKARDRDHKDPVAHSYKAIAKKTGMSAI